jgi:hypothetical protein
MKRDMKRQVSNDSTGASIGKVAGRDRRFKRPRDRGLSQWRILKISGSPPLNHEPGNES